MRRALWLLCLLTACDGEEAADPCAEELRALGARLEHAAARAEPSGAPDWVELLSGERGVPLQQVGALLVITPDDVELAGRGVGGDDAEEAAEALAQDLRAWARAARLDEDDELPVALWAPAETRIERVAEVVRLAPERARFALLVRGPQLEGDAPEWVTESFAMDSVGRPNVRRQRAQRAWRRATRGCEAARPHLPTAGGLDLAGPASGPPSVEPLRAALATCGCDGTGLAHIEAVATRALVPPQGPVLRLAPTLRFGPSLDMSVEQVFDAEDTLATLRDRVAGLEGTVWVRVD